MGLTKTIDTSGNEMYAHKGYRKGLYCYFNDVISIRVAPGECIDSTGTMWLRLASNTSCAINSSGSVNKLDTGSEASSTHYAIHVIGGAGQTTGTLLSTSATAPTLPTNYTHFCHVGWCYNDGSSNIMRFIQPDTGTGTTKKIFYDDAWTNTRILTTGSATGLTNVSTTTFIPTGAHSIDILCEQVDTTSQYWFAVTGSIATGSTPLRLIQHRSGSASSSTMVPLTLYLQGTNIKYKVSNASSTLSIHVTGYEYDYSQNL